MRKNPYFINAVLAVLVGAACLTGVIIRSFFPAVILPEPDVPVMVLFSAVSCAVSYYLKGNCRENRIGSALFSGVTFSLLPFCANLAPATYVWRQFFAGTVVFLVTDFCYEGIARRMDTGDFGKLAPLLNGVMLFLASQCFQGMFF